jgi:two-component system, NarL family, nitrate/nitrite response regulator NarL
MDPDSGFRRIRVLVADGSRIHSQLLANALQQDPDLVITSWDANSSSLIAAVVSQKIDVLAIGSSFGGRAAAGLEIVRELRRRRPQTKVIVLLDSQDAQLVTDAFRAGARGVFNRESSVEMFSKCIRSVDRGEIWADSRGVSLAIDALASIPIIRSVDSAGFNLLSRREFEVVQCVVQGMTNREIAQHLGLSPHTVKNYLFRVFDKLGVSSRVELLFLTLGPNYEAPSRRRGSLIAPEMLQQMLGGPRNRSTMAWLEKAADQGVLAAQLALAQALAERNDSADSVDAYMWFLIAAEQGRQARIQLAEKLTAAQMEQAQRKAGSWFTQAPRSDFVTLSAAWEAKPDGAPASLAVPIAQQATEAAKIEPPRNAQPQTPAQLVNTF